MSEERTKRPFPVPFLLIILLLIGGAAHGYARSAPGPPAYIGQGPRVVAGTPTPTDPRPTPSLDEVHQVSKELYCPLCPGVRLDNCDLPLCDQMREVIRQKLAAGETKEEIKTYFAEQYGEVVLGVPPKRGSMIVVWVLPSLVMLVAGGWVYHLISRRAGQRATDEAEAAASQSLPAEYVERLERELEQFE